MADLVINENDFLSANSLFQINITTFAIWIFINFYYSDFFTSDFGPIPLLLKASIWK